MESSSPSNLPTVSAPISPRELGDFARRLADHAERRIRRQVEIARQIEAAREELLGAHTAAEQRHKTLLATDHQDLIEELKEQRSHALARFQRETTDWDRELAERRDVAAERHTAHVKGLESARKELRWEAETIFSVKRDGAFKHLSESQQQVQRIRDKTQTEFEQARNLLAAWRQTYPPPLQTQLSGVKNNELLPRMTTAAEIVGERLLNLSRLSVPALSAGKGQYLLYFMLAIFLAVGAFLAGLGGIGAAAGACVGLVGSVVISLILRTVSRSQVDEEYQPLAQSFVEVQQLADAALEVAKRIAQMQQAEFMEQRDRVLEQGDLQYRTQLISAEQQYKDDLLKLANEGNRRTLEISSRRDRDLGLAEANRARFLEGIRKQEEAWQATCHEHQGALVRLDERHSALHRELFDEWQTAMQQLAAHTMQHQGQVLLTGHGGSDITTPWSSANATSAPNAVPSAVSFGKVVVPMGDFPRNGDISTQLAQITPGGFAFALAAKFPEQAGMVIQAPPAGRAAALAALQAYVLRLLTTLPPGKARFTIIDPLGLGENFAALMHLADYDDQLVNSRIWTEGRHIEQRLTDLTEHMEDVIQKYLRNEYPTITAYNQEAGEIAEPFRFLIVADYPVNFSDAAQRRLLSIAKSGARCGVFVLLLADVAPVDGGEVIAACQQQGTNLIWRDGGFSLAGADADALPTHIDPLPDPATFTDLLRQTGEAARRASRVQVPFSAIAPPLTKRFTESSQSGLEIPLGRTGASRVQCLRLGEGTAQHVLIAGKTGSGKSTLLHALICNVALRYAPSEVEVYLIDFKQGVEFKDYATFALPHARVVAIESEREFGISVLQRLDEELRQRAERFRQSSAQDLPAFRQAQPGKTMPRILLIVDEFQEFFVDDDRLAQEASLLLDRLVRQGRAFGIHVVLGTQTLAGAYSLARSTIGQMGVRIALQCSEADSNLILSEDNSAARLLSRAGEAIYNDSSGLIEGNHPFQVVWLPEQERQELLRVVADQAIRAPWQTPPQVVFEGNRPAEVSLCPPLAELKASPNGATVGAAPRVWIGKPVAIKEPTSCDFIRRSGANLVLLGQGDGHALGMCSAAIVSLLATGGDLAPHITIMDGSSSGSEAQQQFALLAQLRPQQVQHVDGRQAKGVLLDSIKEMVARQMGSGPGEKPARFLVLFGLQWLRDLRRGDDDFSFSASKADDPNSQLASILREGPPLGLHTIAWCDSLANLQRTWDRAAMREIELRVALQMSSSDASSYIDSPLAAKLGPHRALFSGEQAGILEKFCPYQPPSLEWLEKFLGPG
jgi:DNA segregation ATPase FtsK/SpoIIIE-like protein